MGNISADKTKDKRSCAVKFIHDFVVGHDLDRITHVTASDSGKSRTSKRRKRDLLQQRIEHNIVFIPFSVKLQCSGRVAAQHTTNVAVSTQTCFDNNVRALPRVLYYNLHHSRKPG